MNMTIFALFGFMIFIGLFSQAYAHTTVKVEPYEIEVGWGIEPPIIGYRNDFVFQISQPGENVGVKTGVVNAFRNLDATAKFGNASKILDINSDPRPGHYLSHVIPTQIGLITISLKGEINGISVDVEIPVEDVESSEVLNFPPASNSVSYQDISDLKNSISSIQKDISLIKSGSENFNSSNSNVSYNFAILGLSISGAAIILALLALIKRK
jgi:hypothetical protein